MGAFGIYDDDESIGGLIERLREADGVFADPNAPPDKRYFAKTFRHNARIQLGLPKGARMTASAVEAALRRQGWRGPSEARADQAHVKPAAVEQGRPKPSTGHWESWEGGRKWIDGDGKTAAYYIRKRIGGKRYEIRTPATSESAAVDQLRSFQSNPEGYDPAGDAPREGLYLTAELVAEYLAYSKDEGNSFDWRRKQKNILAWWGDRLEGMDLREVSLDDDIDPALKRRDATAKHHRVAVLKGLYTWLRTVRKPRIKVAEDPVFGQLKVPQGRPAQLTKSKVVPRDHVLLAIEHLSAPWRDALALQAGTGWHTTEILRFAAGGSIEPLPRHAQQDGVAGIVVCPMRKSGEPQRTRVGPDALEAAKRLRAHGPISREWYDRAVRAACATVKRPDGEVGIPPFTPGRLRHSVASWAIDAGADVAQVAAYLGHRSARTTKKFYGTHATPTKVPTLV